MVAVREDYREYSPPRWVRPTVERLLSSLSEGHIGGLSTIVLTDSATADTRKVRRMRRNRAGIVSGRYHPRWAGDGAWIEIVVDRAVPACPQYLRCFQWARDLAIAGVLFHEVGHHLDATVGAAARGGEPAAEAWRSRLSTLHFAKRYGHLRHFRRAAPLLLRFVRIMARRRSRRLRSGRTGAGEGI